MIRLLLSGLLARMVAATLLDDLDLGVLRVLHCTSSGIVNAARLSDVVHVYVMLVLGRRRPSESFHIVVVCEAHLVSWSGRKVSIWEEAFSIVLIVGTKEVSGLHVTRVQLERRCSGSGSCIVHVQVDGCPDRVAMLVVAKLAATDMRRFGISLLHGQHEVAVLTLQTCNYLSAFSLDNLVVTEKVYEHLLVLRLKHTDSDGTGIGYLNLIGAYFETFRVRQHGEHASRPDVLAHLLKLAYEQLVQFIVEAVASCARFLVHHLDLFGSLLGELIL